MLSNQIECLTIYWYLNLIQYIHYLVLFLSSSFRFQLRFRVHNMCEYKWSRLWIEMCMSARHSQFNQFISLTKDHFIWYIWKISCKNSHFAHFSFALNNEWTDPLYSISWINSIYLEQYKLSPRTYNGWWRWNEKK